MNDRLGGQVVVRVRSHRHPLGPLAWVFHTGSLAARSTPWGTWLVGTAAAPLAGDRQFVELALDQDAELHLRSASATLARPGTGGPGGSVTDVRATLARGATLWWHPEPGVSVEGSDHHTRARVTLDPGARLAWLDEVVLGRALGAPGRYRTTLRVERSDGYPLLVSDLVASPGTPADPQSLLTLNTARAASGLVVIDPTAEVDRWRSVTDRDLPPALSTGAVGTALPLSGAGLQVMAWGPSLTDCRRTLAGLTRAAGAPSPLISQVLGDEGPVGLSSVVVVDQHPAHDHVGSPA